MGSVVRPAVLCIDVLLEWTPARLDESPGSEAGGQIDIGGTDNDGRARGDQPPPPRPETSGAERRAYRPSPGRPGCTCRRPERRPSTAHQPA